MLGTIAAADATLSLKGTLGDGLPFTASVAASGFKTYRIFTRTIKGRANSYLAGQISLSAHPNSVEFPGRVSAIPIDNRLVWTKAPGTGDTTYRLGYGPLDKC